jgi:Na+/glutamate symporter
MVWPGTITYEGEYGTAAAFGGAAIASAVGMPGGSEIADAVDAAGEVT